VDGNAGLQVLTRLFGGAEEKEEKGEEHKKKTLTLPSPASGRGEKGGGVGASWPPFTRVRKRQ
jgi:hypothetical protein